MTMITPSYLGETIEYSSLHACRSTLEDPTALIFGLSLSIVLMGVAASLVARLLNRHRWIAYAGLAIIFYVACDMIWRGGNEVWPHLFG